MIIRNIVFSFIFLLFITSCTNNNDDKKYIITNGTEPQNLLIPSNTNEDGGYKVIININSGLIYSDENGEIHNDLADSITTDDNRHYLIKLRDHIKFSDGTEIKSHNFVDAWNFAIKNNYFLASFYDLIEGYPINNIRDFKKLSGLRVIDDKTFEITLKESNYNFMNRLSFIAFFPLPDNAFENIKEYGRNPLSSGPYKLSEKNPWIHYQEINLVPNEYYNGPRKPQNQGIKFRFYPQLSAAYADLLSGQLDILFDGVPNEELDNYSKDFKNHFVKKTTGSNLSIAINFDKHFKLDKEGRLRRKAISMAINRKEIADIILKKTFTPARSYIANIFPELEENNNLKKILSYNPKLAKELWEEADKISKFNDTFVISYNSDATHRDWVEAIVNQLKNNLGIKVETHSYPDFKSFRDDIVNGKISTAYRVGWNGDYYDPINFLAPLFLSYSTGSNDTKYKNDKFDSLLSLAQYSSSKTLFKKLLNQALDILAQDLPVIPLWDRVTIALYNKNIENVIITWNNSMLYYSIIKNNKK